MGLAADREGVFHPFWADARSGTFQIYTAAVTVLSAPSKEPESVRSPGVKAAEQVRAVRDLKGLVELVFDPTRYDAAAGEASIPVRLKNVSKRPIYPPIALEIVGFGFADPDYPDYPASPTTVVNAANGKSGAGARFSFSAALGNLEALAPGALTGAVLMKFRFEDPTQPPPVRLKVEGSVEAEK
jgi:hypothetical protein